MATQKFITIYEQLKQRIHEGEYTYGQQLPSEHELLTLYGASRETVRKALDLLANDGMIQKIRVRVRCNRSRYYGVSVLRID